jgi:UDP-N-acetylglucosamine--dolichyl-phosphate N-acetylglucosaminephosphotransferase
VLTSVVYLFLLHFFGIDGALTLAVCVLFGGFLGLLDDWIDLRWRYKALTPLLASFPLIAWRAGDTVMATYLFGKVDFGIYYYILIIPMILTIITNAVNQLGGLNGLETICPLIVMVGLASVSQERILIYFPIIVCMTLAFFNYQGKIFVGNTGSFAFGITIASYAIIANIEQTLLISTTPYLLNSTLIILNIFLFRKNAHLILEEKKLYSVHKRSLQTLIAYKRPISEHRIVQVISILFLGSTLLSVLI